MKMLSFSFHQTSLELLFVLIPALPPQSVPVFGGFDYVTIDAQRRRVYASHKGSKALLIVDADSGKVLGQVRVGPMGGSQVEPLSGHVFTGNGDGDSVSEVDPVAMKVVRSVDAPGPIDGIVYDPSTARIFADEDDGTRIFVIDAKTFKLIKTIALPGHKPEFITINPRTHEIYQNISDRSEIAVIDPRTMVVKRTIPTPDIKRNHPLQYDAKFNELVVSGTNGVISTYSPSGTRIASLSGVGSFDQCNLDPTQDVLACAGSGGITRFQLAAGAAPKVLDVTPVDPGVHTTAIDPVTHAVFTVWSKRDGSGDFEQKFTPSP